MSVESGRPYKGAIAWMAQNSVAANLLLFLILAAGLAGMKRVKQEVFPEFALDVITVSVPYPGASPSEVEQGILLAIEEEVRGLDGVKRVSSLANEGVGSVSVELLLDADAQQALSDVKTAVDRIQSFPQDAERPIVSLISPRREVISLVVYGETLDRHSLYDIGEKMRSDLLARDGVTQVDVFGVPDLEVAVEVPQETLRSYGLTLEQVARQIAAQSLELPSGGVKAQAGEVLVRVSDRRQTGAELADVVVKGSAGGGQVRLGDIATIRDGFADTDQASFYNGKAAVRVTAYRVGNETPQSVADTVKAYAEQLRADLPANVEVQIWRDDSELLRDRIDLLMRNGRMGAVLVLVVLAAFLELRLAMWVMLGIPASFLGTFFLMPMLGVSVNMVTLFAFIVTLGMVVDDAIVIGENIYAKREAGMDFLPAAIEGAQEMAMPVAFSILTTMAAFAPLLFIPGVMGKIFGFIPIIVIGVLFFSLLESFFVLPAHLAHGSHGGLPAFLRWADTLQQYVTRVLQAFIDRVYTPILEGVLVWRYVSFATAVAVLLATFGAVGAGLVAFTFFPVLEGDLVTVAARLPYGAPVEKTEEVQRALEAAAKQAIAESGGDAIVVGMFTRLGEGVPKGRSQGREVGSHLVTIELALVPSDQREASAEDISAAWRDATPELAGLESLVFSSTAGPSAGAAVDLQLSHPDPAVLEAVSAELTEQLRTYPSLVNVTNTFSGGKPQIDFSLRPEAQTLGLTSVDVARQLRSAFFGAEALREQRGRSELRVMVRLPEEQRSSLYRVEELRVRTPFGGEVPLAQIADASRGNAPTEIRREDGFRVVNVSAEKRPGVKSTRDVLESLEADILPALRARYPRLTAEAVGQQREQSEAFSALGQNYAIALFAIFALLAVPFRSYTQPLIIMTAIPFGIVGAVVGHVVMGFTMSIISAMGIVALSGVVVNDSLVLIDAINKFRSEGLSPHDAVVAGGQRRMRPILLTSLTTFFGLAPMILETSMQARFLVPMAISLGFGVLFATVLILLLVPALYLILEDLHWVADRAWAIATWQPPATSGSTEAEAK